jgi:hypothetical protein
MAAVSLWKQRYIVQFNSANKHDVAPRISLYREAVLGCLASLLAKDLLISRQVAVDILLGYPVTSINRVPISEEQTPWFGWCVAQPCTLENVLPLTQSPLAPRPPRSASDFVLDRSLVYMAIDEATKAKEVHNLSDSSMRLLPTAGAVGGGGPPAPHNENAAARLGVKRPLPLSVPIGGVPQHGGRVPALAPPPKPWAPPVHVPAPYVPPAAAVQPLVGVSANASKRLRAADYGEGEEAGGERAVEDVVQPAAAAALRPGDLSAEQAAVHAQAMSGRSIFFTGSAGTGKSFLLRKLIADLQAKYEALGKADAVYVVAPTGIAACNIGGITIHSFAGIGIDCDSKSAAELASDVSKRGPAVKRWKTAAVLVIDEVSMLDGNLFDKLDHVARKTRSRDGQPWGGIQLVLAGDFFQLPPVGLSNNTGAGAAPGAPPRPKFCFQANAWNQAIHAQFSLRKVFRQTDDAFVRILNELRRGIVSLTTEQAFNGSGWELRSMAAAGSQVRVTKLFTRNMSVDNINAQELAKCSGSVRQFNAADAGEAQFRESLAKNCPAPGRVELKVGAQVILLKNIDSGRGLVNGARGVVHDFEGEKGSEYPVVMFLRAGFRLDDPRSLEEYKCTPETWTTEMGGREVASRVQVPLKLAYALTVHKSQGMTIDCVEIDLSGVFESGQAYVALSRAVSMGRMVVKGFRRDRVTANPEVREFYRLLEGGAGRGVAADGGAGLQPAAFAPAVYRPPPPAPFSGGGSGGAAPGGSLSASAWQTTRPGGVPLAAPASKAAARDAELDDFAAAEAAAETAYDSS